MKKSFVGMLAMTAMAAAMGSAFADEAKPAPAMTAARPCHLEVSMECSLFPFAFGRPS